MKKVAIDHADLDGMEERAAGLLKVMLDNGLNPDNKPSDWVTMLFLTVRIGVRHMDLMSGMPMMCYIFQTLWLFLAAKDAAEESSDSDKQKKSAESKKYEEEATDFLKTVDAPLVS